MKNLPDLKHEKSLWKKGFTVIGIDEVGRGCLAGPLTVGAVIFEKIGKKQKIEELESIGINDSKKLTSKKREELSKIIKKSALYYSCASINVSVINKRGIVKATQMAVRKAIKRIMNHESGIRNKNNKFLIHNSKFFILADAFYIKYVKGIGLKNQKAIIHGDGISISIAAASIIAKVTRDKLMGRLSKKHPEYNWSKNKGYGTHDHILALKKHGKTSYHRELFISKIIY
ncbi:MAG: hypothetical protein A2857_01980 [Candidatus Levybacteria bacterium RIFCSPHIGHO2_01_FULL_36_15]|nr:MAG: hypothetical protein A2857_01980 [Candidatus Levybacteria bacterium RIFCSPHIGHO2_01_FULL_36_15]OGH38708.1 MAG: hypothetical protein A2905_02895 [Candidatus Levybacteria bacterium RIFCSPLOWO2_01_FULL_36_10]